MGHRSSTSGTSPWTCFYFTSPGSDSSSPRGEARHRHCLSCGWWPQAFLTPCHAAVPSMPRLPQHQGNISSLAPGCRAGEAALVTLAEPLFILRRQDATARERTRTLCSWERQRWDPRWSIWAQHLYLLSCFSTLNPFTWKVRAATAYTQVLQPKARRVHKAFISQTYLGLVFDAHWITAVQKVMFQPILSDLR